MRDPGILALRLIRALAPSGRVIGVLVTCSFVLASYAGCQRPVPASGPGPAGQQVSRPAPTDKPEYVTPINGAANPESIPRHDVLWTLFVRIASRGERSALVSTTLLSTLGLDDHDATSLVEYAQASLEEDRRYQQQLMRDFCAGLDSSVTAEVLASKLEATERETNHWREARVAALSTLLDPKSNESLDQWVARNRGSMGTVKVNFHTMLQNPQAKDAVLRRAIEGCKALSVSSAD